MEKINRIQDALLANTKKAIVVQFSNILKNMFACVDYVTRVNFDGTSKVDINDCLNPIGNIINNWHPGKTDHQGAILKERIKFGSRDHLVKKINQIFDSVEQEVKSLYKMDQISFGVLSNSDFESYTLNNCQYMSHNSHPKLEEYSTFWLSDSSSLFKDEICQIQMLFFLNDNKLEFTDYPGNRTRNYKKPRSQCSHPIDTNLQWIIYADLIFDKQLGKTIIFESIRIVDQFPLFQ